MTAEALLRALPRHLSADAQAAVQLLPRAHYRPASPFPVTVMGEPLVIPYRVYLDEPSPDRQAALAPTAAAILDCLYTRHHEGRVRQRRIERVIGLVEPWVAPFAVQLLGEYVEEIVLMIQRRLAAGLVVPGTLVYRVYGRFAAENPSFVELTRQRATSYWNCYHRWRYPRLADYPGYTMTRALQTASRGSTAAKSAP